MDLSIILVSYNTKDLTIKCLESIFLHIANRIDFEVIIVDNLSVDGSQDALLAFEASHKAQVKFIAETSNSGFAKANNLALRYAHGNYILLLNTDTYLLDDSCIAALRYLEKNPSVFGCGCSLLNGDGSEGISYGKFPGFMTILIEILTGNFGALRCIVPKPGSAIYPIDFPCGAFFLIRRELFDTVGQLDEKFFMYFEETDLAKRAWKLGLQIVYFGPAKIVHLRGQSSTPHKFPALKNALDLKTVSYQSWYYFMQKHCSFFEIFALKCLLVLYFKTMHAIFFLKKNSAACNQYRAEEKGVLENWNGHSA